MEKRFIEKESIII